MTKPLARNLLLAALLGAAAFAAWAWFRPYEIAVDPAAGCRIAAASVTRDHTFYWLDLELEIQPDFPSAAATDAILVTAGGKSIRPSAVDRALLRFWLDSAELSAPLVLRIHRGRLTVKSTTGLPEIPDRATLAFRTHRW